MKVRNYSRKREAILAKLRSSTCHPTADWVYQELKDEYPNLSLGTVYRNLGIFKEEGTITSVCNVAGQERFDGYTQSHGHFVCRQCRAVTDIDLQPGQPELISYLKQDQTVQVDRVDLTVYGTCAACLEAEQSSNF